jgi:hypothetical protein
MKLTIGGEEIKGVMKADVKIYHTTTRDPERVPVMEWDITMGLQNKAMLALWAMAKADLTRFKKCILEVHHRDATVAHTWTLTKAFVYSYTESEFPALGGPAFTTDAGNCIHVVIRGDVLHAEDYDGKNVMQVVEGKAEGPAQ